MKTTPALFKAQDAKTSEKPGYTAGMVYDEKAKIFKFTEEFVENYIDYLWEKKYDPPKNPNPWNRTQLTVIVETVVAFIEQISVAYTAREFYGCDLWLLNELSKINDYAGQHGYVTRASDDAFREITNPFCKQWHQLYKQGLEWLSNFAKEIEYPFTLFAGDFWRLNLQAYQSRIWPGFKQAQREEAMHILNELLIIARQTLQNSPLYQQAAATEGGFYENLVPKKITQARAAELMKKPETVVKEASTLSSSQGKP